MKTGHNSAKFQSYGKRESIVMLLTCGSHNIIPYREFIIRPWRGFFLSRGGRYMESSAQHLFISLKLLNYIVWFYSQGQCPHSPAVLLGPGVPAVQGWEHRWSHPTLFSEDQRASSEAISANPQRAFADYQRFIRALFMPEYVEPAEAAQLVKKPR